MTREKRFGTGITHDSSKNSLCVQLNYVPYEIAINIFNLRTILICS